MKLNKIIAVIKYLIFFFLIEDKYFFRIFFLIYDINVKIIKKYIQNFKNKIYKIYKI